MSEDQALVASKNIMKKSESDVEQIPEGLSKQEKLKWARKNRDYPEITLEDFMALPHRDDFDRLYEPGDKFRLTHDAERGGLSAYMEVNEVAVGENQEIQSIDIQGSQVFVSGGEPDLRHVNLEIRACWII